MEPYRRWLIVPSGPSITDWIPGTEDGEHTLGAKCPCHPKKALRREGPHVLGVMFKHENPRPENDGLA